MKGHFQQARDNLIRFEKRALIVFRLAISIPHRTFSGAHKLLRARDLGEQSSAREGVSQIYRKDRNEAATLSRHHSPRRRSPVPALNYQGSLNRKSGMYDRILCFSGALSALLSEK